MSESVARAVAANGTVSIKIAGKECTIRPLGVRELCELERDCLDRYKRNYLKSIYDNLDLMPDCKDKTLFMQVKIEEVARWSIDDLPGKFVHDPSRINMNEKLQEWVISYWGLEVNEDDKATYQKQLRKLATASLDQGALSDKKYEELTGLKPPKVKVGYVDWWTTGDYEGMITMMWLCFKPNGITREQVLEEFSSNMARLTELTREIEKLTAPSVGNG